MVTEEYYNELIEKMAKKRVKTLIKEFNQRVGCRTFTSLSGLYNSILIDTLIKKGVDVSAVFDGVFISFDEPVALNDDKNKLILVRKAQV